MKQKMFDHFKPKMNSIKVEGGVMWRVCYHNAGQARYSAELVAWVTKEKVDDKEVVQIILASDIKNPMTPEEFEDYRRRQWPLAHEDGRNPDNKTLGVQSGVVKAKGGL